MRSFIVNDSDPKRVVLQHIFRYLVNFLCFIRVHKYEVSTMLRSKEDGVRRGMSVGYGVWL
jgi:hypothetical protein